MIFTKEQVYLSSFPHANCILAADIGGTNSRFGVFFGDKNQLVLGIELYMKSSMITDFHRTVNQLLLYIKKTYNVEPEYASFGIAGALENDRTKVKPTNLPFVIDSAQLRKEVSFKKIYLLNDFEAMAYGLPVLKEQDFSVVREGIGKENGTQLIVGAGTGLGKSFLLWDHMQGHYLPQPSEGGHADFTVHSSFDFNFMCYCQQQSPSRLCIISWEDVLAGRSITSLYKFLIQTRSYPHTKIMDALAETGYSPKDIFAHHKSDQACADTYTYYGQWYGRCIKNFALEILPYGGIFIAGGIAAGNSPLFHEPFFIGELTGCSLQARLIDDIPISVILNTQTGLYGAAVYCQKKYLEIDAF